MRIQVVERLFIPGRAIAGFLEKAVFVIPDNWKDNHVC